MTGSSFDLDLRVVRYVVAVADHGGFGRAAEAIGLSQPSLSRQVRRLERRLGGPLFVRRRTGTDLTVAGEVFLLRARALLRDADRLVESVQVGSAVVVGHAPGLDVTSAVLAARRDGVTVRTRQLGWCDAGEAVSSGDVDVAVARLPFRTDGLHVRPLFHEPRRLAVGRDHPLATRSSVSVDDLRDEAMPVTAHGSAAARAFWRLEHDLGPRPVGTEESVTSLDDSWQRVAQGDVVAVVTESQARVAPQDLVLVPIVDVSPARVVAASRRGDPSSSVSTLSRHLADSASLPS